MRETLLVSNRGQITLPVALRKRYGIQGGDAVILEEHNNEIVLKPAAVMEIQLYSDDQIGEWDAQDTLTDEQRKHIVEALGPPTK